MSFNLLKDFAPGSLKVKIISTLKDMVRDAWAKVYQTISEKEDAQPLDQIGDSIKKEASYDFVRSYQLLGLADGANSDMIVKSAQKDPSIASGALLSYLHLRYLDIREQKLVCLAQVRCSLKRILF